MNCPTCNKENEPECRFCADCGRSLESQPTAVQSRSRKNYLYALLLIPVIALAAGVGYYKYILPQGIAAVVNGEEISLAELDAEVGRSIGADQAADSRLRYQVLNSMITERIVLQEARKAGVTLSAEEAASAINAARAASGQSAADFEQQTAARYGSMGSFENVVTRRVLVNKFLTEKVVPANGDVRTSRAALEHWLQERSAAASVRITLAEQWSGAGCGCCASKAEAAPFSDRSAKAGAGAGTAAAPASDADRAADAGIRYWQQKHGAGKVTAKVSDFGCHMQVDIVKDDKTVGSLRYQAGTISEL